MLLSGTTSYVSTLSLPDVTSLAFPSVYAYCNDQTLEVGTRLEACYTERYYVYLGSELMNQLRYKEELAFPGPLTKFGLQYKVYQVCEPHIALPGDCFTTSQLFLGSNSENHNQNKAHNIHCECSRLCKM